MGLMGYRTPNIDRITKEGMMFTDYCAEQSCTAGRSTFITGQVPASPKSESQALRSAYKTATSPSPRRSSR